MGCHDCNVFSRDSLQTVNLTVSIVRGFGVCPIPNVSWGNFRSRRHGARQLCLKNIQSSHSFSFSLDAVQKQPVQTITAKANEAILSMNTHSMTYITPKGTMWLLKTNQEAISAWPALVSGKIEPDTERRKRTAADCLYFIGTHSSWADGLIPFSKLWLKLL